MKRFNLPLTKDEILSLELYEQLTLTGTIYVARDQSHLRLVKLIEEKKDLPFNLENACIYYMGQSPKKDGDIIGSCGPTTSARMDVFTPTLLDNGVQIAIGKGPRNRKVLESLFNNTAVYLQAYGGCGALYSKSVVSNELIAFEDLVSEALFKLTVVDFPVFVAIDAKGNSIF